MDTTSTHPQTYSYPQCRSDYQNRMSVCNIQTLCNGEWRPKFTQMKVFLLYSNPHHVCPHIWQVYYEVDKKNSRCHWSKNYQTNMKEEANMMAMKQPVSPAHKRPRTEDPPQDSEVDNHSPSVEVVEPTPPEETAEQELSGWHILESFVKLIKHSPFAKRLGLTCICLLWSQAYH